MKKFVPKTYNIPDFYVAYASMLLKENPDYYSTYHRTNRVKHYYIYKNSKRGPILIIDYKQFSNIMQEYFKTAIEKLMEGKAFDLMSSLGYIEVVRAKRNPKNMRPNWGESLKYRNELIKNNEPLTEVRPMRDINGNVKKDANGQIKYKEYKKWMVYFTNEDYPYIRWVKHYRTYLNGRKVHPIANLLYYEFKPPISYSTERGFLNRLHRMYREDPRFRRNFKSCQIK